MANIMNMFPGGGAKALHLRESFTLNGPESSTATLSHTLSTIKNAQIIYMNPHGGAGYELTLYTPDAGATWRNLSTNALVGLPYAFNYAQDGWTFYFSFNISGNILTHRSSKYQSGFGMSGTNTPYLIVGN